MAYQYMNPYSEPLDASPVCSDDEFDIDEVHDDMRDILEQVNGLNFSAIQRQLAGATIRNQERRWSKWKEFCASYQPKQEPEKLLTKALSGAIFCCFLEWYRSKSNAKRLTAFEGLWKGIRQLYYDKTHKCLPDTIGDQVTNYLQTIFAEKHNLERGMKPKHTIGHHTLMGMLHHHWTFDTSRFSHERERVQLPTVLLFLAYTGVRPGAIIESSCYRNTGQALLYRDVKLKLLQPPMGPSLLILEVTIRLDKGKRDRPEPKTITLYENRNCPAMCPVAHFLGLAFADRALHPALMEQGLTPAKLHTFKSPEGRVTIEFKFRDDILDIAVFRGWKSGFNGVEIDPVKPLKAQFLNEECRRLGEQAGLEHRFTPYCLRREVGTELTGKVTDPFKSSHTKCPRSRS